MEYRHLQVSVDHAVARVTLNRPERLNALNTRLIEELNTFFGDLTADSDTRVVILVGGRQGR